MARSIFTICFLIFGISSMYAQTSPFWTDLDQSQLLTKTSSWESLPTEYYAAGLDLTTLEQYLAKAPMELTAAARKKPLELALPLPDGSYATFAVVESPVMQPGLAAKYPHMKNYAGKAIDRPGYSTRFGLNDWGFHAVIRSPQGLVYIDAYNRDLPQEYVVYYTHKVSTADIDFPPVSCGWDGNSLETPIPPSPESGKPSGSNKTAQELVNLNIYALALACTGEYAQNHGGTVASVMASFNTAVNRVNEILQSESAIKFVLLSQTDLLIFLDPNNDPYENSSQGLELLGQNPGVINTVFSPDDYDIGHVFTGPCSDVGGVAGGTVCSINKARGVTCHWGSNVVVVAENTMAHELAHQFSASHSWANCPSSMGQLAPQGAFEPGSGSTIMSYQGACGNQNISPPSGIYYHVVNLQQMKNYVEVGLGNTCPTVTQSDNHYPEVVLPYEDGFYIPISTPFELDATASDEDGDDLLYCWEQFDLGPVTELGEPAGDAPIFRSFPPTEESFRVFPRLNRIINNSFTDEEVLPTYSRNLTFRCTVRDLDPVAGGTIWEEVAFKATESAGPFQVLHPNSLGIQWQGGDYVEVTWDVANTDNNLVKCQAVDILLSTDGGYTYPYTLLSSTPNTGSAFVTVPDVNTQDARIKVQAAQNIFFDISNLDFFVTPATQPTYTFDIVSPVYQQVCLPDAVSLDLVSGSLLNYDSTLQVSISTDLPSGITAEFGATTLSPGEGTQLDFDFSGLTEDTLLEVEIQVIAGSTDTTYRTLYFDLVNSDYSAMSLDLPASGTTNLPTNTNTFKWTGVPNADLYDIQIATSPAFGETIIDEGYNLSTTDFVTNAVLLESSLYFWRVRPKNRCGLGEWLPTAAFHTVVTSCEEFKSNNIPLNIPGNGTPTVVSELSVFQEGIIEDLNVIDLMGYHETLVELGIYLQSPEGTEVLLFEKICGNIAPFHLDLDDEANLGITCPPNDGFPHRPLEELSAFDGENTTGIWKLKAKVLDEFANGGVIDDWGIAFCASFTPKAPYIVNNNTLNVQPGEGRTVFTDFLLCEDEDNTADELTYTLMSEPQHGTLYRGANDPLEVGETFSQELINENLIWYQHSGDGSEEDAFRFIVEDGTGGWINSTEFLLVMDTEAPVATEEIEGKGQLSLFPNPTTGQLTVQLPDAWSSEGNTFLFNAQGQLIRSYQTQPSMTLNLADLPKGIYLLQVSGEHGVLTERVVVQ